MINQLSYVTKKFQHHTIDEAGNKGAKVTSEDRDSGTESDDEQTFDEPEITSEMSSEMSSGCSVRSRPTSQTSTDTLTFEELPVGGDAPDMPPPSATQPASSSTFGNHPHHHHHRRNTRHNHHYLLRAPNNPSGRESPPGGDPFVPADYDVSDPVEHHSSEEELETLTGDWSRDNAPLSEKRKWSQVARLSVTDSGSSDDEICVLTTGTRPPVEFRTSPPLEAHKPLRSASPPSKMLNLSLSQPEAQQHTLTLSTSVAASASIPTREELRLSTLGAEGGVMTLASSLGAPNMNGLRGEQGARAASPRKRHRHTPRPHRPCLDFEKMQQMKNRAVTQWRNGGELSLSFF